MIGGGLGKLQRVVLDGNKLLSIEFSPELPELEVVSLCENHLETVHGLRLLPQLQELYLDGNELGEVPVVAQGIKSLSLKHNKVCAVHSLCLRSLEYLNLSHNSIVSFTNSALPSLKELHLCYNKLTEIPLFSAQLRTLDISHNSVSSLQSLSAYPTLTTLNAKYNPFSSETQTYLYTKSLSSLEVLDLRGVPMDPQQRLDLILHFCGTIRELNGQPITEEEFAQEKTGSFRQPSGLSPSPRLFPTVKHSPSSNSETGNLWDSQPLELPLLESPSPEELLDTFSQPFDNELLSVSPLDSLESLQVTPALEFSQFFAQKEQELATRVSRLQDDAKHLTQDSRIQFTPLPPQSETSYNDSECSRKRRGCRRHRCCCSHHHSCRRGSKRSSSKSTATGLQMGTPALTMVDEATSPVHSSMVRTPRPLGEITVNSLVNRAREDSASVVMHAGTPPRPILQLEANVPVITQLPSRSTEFSVLAQLFAEQNAVLVGVTKTYTFALHREFKENQFNTSQGLGTERTETARVMFYVGGREECQKVFSSPCGFGALCKRLEFCGTLGNGLERVYKDQSVLMALVRGAGTQQRLMTDSASAIPVYLAEYK